MAAELNTILKLAIPALLFAMGLHASFRESLYLWARPALLIRSLVAMYVAVPLLAIALAVTFDLPRGTELAMIILAICAGAPLLPRKVLKLGGDPDFGISLAVVTSLLAIVTVPLSLRALGGLVELESGLGPGEVASAILWSFLLPFGAGMGVRAVAPAFAARLSDPLLGVAGTVLIVGTLLKVAFGWRILLGIGAPDPDGVCRIRGRFARNRPPVRWTGAREPGGTRRRVDDAARRPRPADWH